MKIVCDILDEKNIQYDWYVLGAAFTTDVFDEIQGWFKENKNVHFLGYKDNVNSYIKKMDYLALLSDREAWGLVISEALILGVPAIATAFEGVEKQITDKENGIIFDMTNSDNGYQRKVEDMIQLKAKLKENVMKKDYSREAIIDQWRRLIDGRDTMTRKDSLYNDEGR